MAEGAVRLSDLGDSSRLLDVRCTRCDRHGRYRIATLVHRYGANARLPDVASALEADCPRKGQHDGCFVTFLGLV